MEKKMTEYEELFRSATTEERYALLFEVISMDVHPTKPWFLMTSKWRCINIWNFRLKKLEMQFMPQSSDHNIACSAKFIARKDWVVAGLESNCIAIYNYVTGTEVALFWAHMDSVTSVAVHPTLSYVLSSSKDSLIKLWDWNKAWACIRVFEGHSYRIVTQVTFNPKHPNTFASASWDSTVKVWNLGSSDPDFSLDGHENEVVCVDYYTGDDKPYLISGSYDGTAKVWDYETKTCIQTLQGHDGYVTTASFHPHLPIIVTGSYSGKVRYWDSNTYRLDNVQDYGIEVGCIAYTKGFARVAIMCASLLIVVKVGCDRPVASMDPQSGKILLAKHNIVQIANIKHENVDYKVIDGERLSLVTEESFRCNIYPQYIKHSRDGRCVVIGGDGECSIWTRDIFGWNLQGGGYASEFVWSFNGEFAFRETDSNRIQIFPEPKTIYKPLFTAERIFGGKCLAIGCSKFICFFEWEYCKLIHKLDIAQVENLYWAGTSDLVAITTPTSLFIFKYQQENKNGAFELVYEANERVSTGLWVYYNCFVYVNSSWRLNYCLGTEVTTFFYLDRPMYLLGYIVSRGRVYLFDMEFNVVGCTLPLHLIKYKRLVMSGELGTANAFLPTIPIKHRDSAARFLESKGMLEAALDVATSPDYRFELAIQLGKLEIAKEIATSEDESESKWKRLGELSMLAGKFEMAEECLNKAKDVSGLLLLYSSLGDAQGMSRLATMAQHQAQYNVAFLCLFMLGRLEDCLQLLVDSNRIPEAALMARSYLAVSKVSKVVRLWTQD